MGIFDIFKKKDIDQGVEEFNSVKGAVLLDVRTAQEYAEGHIPKSVNIPLQTIEKISSKVKDINTPLYVYCYSGARSSQACGLLKRMGYTNVNDIGGIASYSGNVEY